MRERFFVDGIEHVRRGKTFVTRATDTMLRNIDKAAREQAKQRKARAMVRVLRGKA